MGIRMERRGTIKAVPGEGTIRALRRRWRIYDADMIGHSFKLGRENQDKTKIRA